MSDERIAELLEFAADGEGRYLDAQIVAAIRDVCAERDALRADRDEWKRRAEGDAQAHDDTRYNLEQALEHEQALRARLAAQVVAKEQFKRELMLTIETLHERDKRLAQAEPIIAAVARGRVSQPSYSEPIMSWNDEPIPEGAESVAVALRDEAQRYILARAEDAYAGAEHAQPGDQPGDETEAIDA